MNNTCEKCKAAQEKVTMLIDGIKVPYPILQLCPDKNCVNYGLSWDDKKLDFKKHKELVIAAIHNKD